MYSTSHIFCCYHPDFIQDGESYRILPTGRWIVEWDELHEKDINTFIKTLFFSRKHHRKEFLTAEEAEEFINILHKQEKVFD